MKSIWKGSLNFGLVNIPVEMHSASRVNEINFTLLHKKDLSEIRYARICKKEDKEVPWDEIVKGWENSDGNYVVMTDEDIKKAIAAKSNTIDILQFTEENDIDSIYFEKPYVLVPQKDASKPYFLLVQALKKSKKVGIAKYVLHNREHIGAIKVYDNFIIINQLRYNNEILSFDDLKAPAEVKIAPKELEIAMQLINYMDTPFKPEKFKDTYTDDLKRIIKQKEKGKKVYPKEGAAATPSKKIHDIMSLLKASLQEKEKKPKRSHRASA